MKKIFILLFFIFRIYSQTNSQSSIYVKKGETITAPYTGWLFNRESSKKLIEHELSYYQLKRENELLNLEIKGYKEINNQYSIELSIYRKYIDIKEKDSSDLKKFLWFSGGFLGGILITSSSYLIYNLSKDK